MGRDERVEMLRQLARKSLLWSGMEPSREEGPACESGSLRWGQRGWAMGGITPNQGLLDTDQEEHCVGSRACKEPKTVGDCARKSEESEGRVTSVSATLLNPTVLTSYSLHHHLHHLEHHS